MDHLPEQEAQHVIHKLIELFLYAYKTKNKKMKITMENLKQHCYTGSEILFKNEHTSKKLIDQYLQLHPELPKEDVEMMERFRGCYKQHLYVMCYEKKVTFIMDRKHSLLYGVRGITDSLAVTLHRQTLPCIVHYAILPYKDFFILDSVGKTRMISDISVVIGLFEEFRDIAKEKGVLLSENKKKAFYIVERNMQAPIEEVFNDYMMPLIYFKHIAGKQNINEIYRFAMDTWNFSYGSDEIAIDFYGKELFKKYVKPMMEHRRKAFADVRFMIKKLWPPLEEGTLMRIEGEEIENSETCFYDNPRIHF